MKTNIFLLALAILTNFSIAQAQYCWHDINTITTKWDEPNTTNTENWDWTLSGLKHPVYLNDNLSSPSILVELPYFCTKPTGSGSCNNRNTYSYEILALDNKQDIYPENGWELVIKDFGTPNEGAIAGRGVKNPIFILYNRYTAKMKIYLAIIGKTEANSAYLQIYFSDIGIKRGLFTHATPIAQPAVAFDPKANFKTLNDYAMQNFDTHYQWLVSEVQLAYDPCTCQKNQGQSSIEITTMLIKKSDFTASIDGLFTQTLMSATNGVSGGTDLKTAFFETTGAAIRGYNDFTSYQRQLNAILDKSNGKYKDKLVKEWFDAYVKNNPQYQGVLGLHDKYDLWDALGRTDDEFKKSIGMSKIDAYQNNSNFRFLKSVASYMPYVGSAIGLINFLINGGKEESEPKPSPPMVFNVNLKLSGTITTTINRPPVAFLTPGANNYSTGAQIFPIYNNTLGVFNILKAPLVDMAGIKPNIDDTSYVYNMNGYPENGRKKLHLSVSNAQFRNSCIDMYHASNIFKQYKLHEDIKYLLNPASNLTMELIDACFILQYKGEDAKLLITNTRFSDDIHNNPSLPFYPNIFKQTTTFSDRIAQIENTGLDLEYVDLKEDIIRFRTKYVPLSCLKNQSFLLFDGKAPTVYVKMLVKMRRKDNPNAELITQVVTYDISSAFINPIETETNCKIKLDRMDIYDKIHQTLDQSDSELSDDYKASFVTFSLYENEGESFNHTLSHPDCLPFSTILKPENKTYFPGMASASINGVVNIPNNTIVSANTWIKAQQIILGNNITILGGVQLIAEKDIIIPPDCIINPSAEISASPYGNIDLWRCADINIADLHATDEEIETKLCSKDSYIARVQSKKENDDLLAPSEQMKPAFNFSLYPNPAKNSITLTLQLTETDNLSISVLDIVGKTVAEGIELKDAQDQSLININLSGLDNGVYFCSLVNQQNERIVKKFIIAK